MADVLCEFADELEKADDFEKAVLKLIQETIKKHKRIIFNGNGYSEEWVAEAKKRGLPNINSMVDAVAAQITERSIRLFTKHGVLTEAECYSRAEINYEDYIKQINIEAKTMLDMAAKQIKPAVIQYAGSLARDIVALKDAGADTSVEEELFGQYHKRAERV